MLKFRKYLIYLVIVLAFILVATNGFTFAKYVSNSVWNYYLNSKGFYFTSDDLSASGMATANNIWDGGKVNFNLKNSLNDAVVTEYDINYKVTCNVLGEAASIATCKINGTNSNTYSGVLSNYKECVNNNGDGVDVSSYDKATCEINGYDWINNQAISNLYFELVKTGDKEIDSAVVEIIATATSPFKKTISGKYTLHKDQSLIGMLTKSYSEYADYSSLVIGNSYTTDKCVNIKWNSSDLRFDLNSNSVISFNIDTSGYVNEITIKVNSKDSNQYIFYKNKLDTIYNKDAFSLTELDTCP